MPGACGDHQFIGDGCSSISCKDLALLLLSCEDGKGGGRVDAGKGCVGSGHERIDFFGLHKLMRGLPIKLNLNNL